MKKFAAISIFFGFALYAGESSGNDTEIVERHGPDQRIEIDDSLFYHILHRKYGEFPFAVHIIKAKQKKYHLIFKIAEDNHGTSLSQFFEHGPNVAAISGSYLATFHPPIPAGYVKAPGFRSDMAITRDDIVADSVVCIGTVNDPTEVTFRKVYDGLQHIDTERYERCRQVGPMLVQNSSKRIFDGGKIDSQIHSDFSRGEYHRVALGIGSDDSVYFIWTTRMKLEPLSVFMSTPRDQGGLGLKTAVALPGRESAGMVWVTLSKDEQERKNMTGSMDTTSVGGKSFLLFDAFLMQPFD